MVFPYIYVTRRRVVPDWGGVVIRRPPSPPNKPEQPEQVSSEQVNQQPARRSKSEDVKPLLLGAAEKHKFVSDVGLASSENPAVLREKLAEQEKRQEEAFNEALLGASMKYRFVSDVGIAANPRAEPLPAPKPRMTDTDEIIGFKEARAKKLMTPLPSHPTPHLELSQEIKPFFAPSIAKPPAPVEPYTGTIRNNMIGWVKKPAYYDPEHELAYGYGGLFMAGLVPMDSGIDTTKLSRGGKAAYYAGDVLGKAAAGYSVGLFGGALLSEGSLLAGGRAIGIAERLGGSVSNPLLRSAVRGTAKGVMAGLKGAFIAGEGLKGVHMIQSGHSWPEVAASIGGDVLGFYAFEKGLSAGLKPAFREVARRRAFDENSIIWGPHEKTVQDVFKGSPDMTTVTAVRKAKMLRIQSGKFPPLRIEHVSAESPVVVPARYDSFVLGRTVSGKGLIRLKGSPVGLPQVADQIKPFRELDIVRFKGGGAHTPWWKTGNAPYPGFIKDPLFEDLARFAKNNRELSFFMTSTPKVAKVATAVRSGSGQAVLLSAGAGKEVSAPLRTPRGFKTIALKRSITASAERMAAEFKAPIFPLGNPDLNMDIGMDMSIEAPKVPAPRPGLKTENTGSIRLSPKTLIGTKQKEGLSVKGGLKIDLDVKQGSGELLKIAPEMAIIPNEKPAERTKIQQKVKQDFRVRQRLFEPVKFDEGFKLGMDFRIDVGQELGFKQKTRQGTRLRKASRSVSPSTPSIALKPPSFGKLKPPSLGRPKSRRKKRRKSRGKSDLLGEIDLFEATELDLEGITVAKISKKKFKKLYSSGQFWAGEPLSLVGAKRGKKKGKGRKSKKKKGWKLL